MSLLPHALAGHAAGLSLIPCLTDGTKAPALSSWKPYQTQCASIEQLRAWFGPHKAYGVVCGAVSGNLEMLEAEGRAVDAGLVEQLVEHLDDHGLSSLWERLKSGWMELTPSGGVHWYYRVDGPPRANMKLARRPATLDELAVNPDEKIKVLFETRGEGGFSVLAPSIGHESGKPWQQIINAGIPTLTVNERDALHAVASLLDQMPVVTPPARLVTGSTATGDRPGDDYNNRADWADLLLPRGWTLVSAHGKTRYWRRPGKSVGISATTGRNDGDNLYVFSTSTELEAETPYSKFHAYTLLEHHGDWAAAAKKLRGEGYGKPYEPQRPVSPMTGLPTDGNLAVVHQLDSRRQAVAQVTLEHSDDGNALALVDRHGKQIRYCSDRGRWLTWDGQRWQWEPVGGGRVVELFREVARDFDDTDKAAAKHKKASLSFPGTRYALAHASTDARVAISLDDLDAHPWELNTPAGIVDLRTGTLRPPDPSRLHTRMTSCSPDPDANPRRWHDFLSDTFGDNTALVAFLQRLVGYSATGSTGRHVLPFCYGSGGNGKGVFLEAVTKVLGSYATTAPSGFLMRKVHTEHQTEIARLSGARMVVCSEVNEDDQFDEAKVKLLTGGDTLTARFMNQDHFTFTPTHKLWAVGNHRPAVRSGGRAFWRRLRLIGFEREVPLDKMVDDLQNLLAGEHGPAVLHWIVTGAVDYAARRDLAEPDTVMAATLDYAHDQDTVGRFLEERCEVTGNPEIKVKVALVREAYEAWCREVGETPVTARALSLALSRRGVVLERNRHARLFGGLYLLGNEDQEGRLA